MPLIKQVAFMIAKDSFNTVNESPETSGDLTEKDVFLDAINEA